MGCCVSAHAIPRVCAWLGSIRLLKFVSQNLMERWHTLWRVKRIGKLRILEKLGISAKKIRALSCACIKLAVS